jgi:SAM-dependent methyltransferase
MATGLCMAEAPTADAALRGLIFGFRSTQLVYVAAQLKLADHLAHGPRSAAALAEACNAVVCALRRLLRALHSHGLVQRLPDDRYASTPLGERLRAAAPGSLRDLAVLYGAPWLWQAWGELLHAVQTGDNAFEQAHGEPLYDYLAARPPAAHVFQRAMSAYTKQENDALVAAIDLGDARSAVDVGGGHGELLRALLQRHAGLHGILFERPAVVAAHDAARTRDELGQRLQAVAGDFFASVPAGADLYLLKNVLHNWRDDDALRLLRSCRDAMRPGARLLVVERLLDAPDEANAADEARFDIHMLVAVGGQLRSSAEHAALCAAAGLRFVSATPTASALGIVAALR